MNEREIALISVGILIGGFFSFCLYDFYVIPEIRKSIDDFWLDYIWRMIESDGLSENYKLASGELSIITQEANYTIGLEGNYTCVYEGEYEDGETSIFKSLSSSEAIKWALER